MSVNKLGLRSEWDFDAPDIRQAPRRDGVELVNLCKTLISHPDFPPPRRTIEEYTAAYTEGGRITGIFAVNLDYQVEL